MTTEELEKETLAVIGKVMAQSRKIIDEQRMKIADLQAANKAMMLQANTDGGNAQPVQPSALQRLDDWWNADEMNGYVIRSRIDYVEVILWRDGADEETHGSGDTLADAINAALGAAEASND